MNKKDFLWGVATASTQIEGAANQDDKSETVWDVMSQDGDFIANNHKVDDADDSYNRFDEDLELLKKLGVNSYRFSLSWRKARHISFADLPWCRCYDRLHIAYC